MSVGPPQRHLLPRLARPQRSESSVGSPGRQGSFSRRLHLILPSGRPRRRTMTVAGKLKASYPRRRRGPAEDQVFILEREEEQQQQQEEEEEEEEEEGTQGRAPGSHPPGDGAGCASKKVAFASLPDKYEPLEPPPAEDGERKGKKRRRKLKKYGKNVGKVLRKGCRYLFLGLQGLANAYSSPLGVAASVAAVFR